MEFRRTHLFFEKNNFPIMFVKKKKNVNRKIPKTPDSGSGGQRVVTKATHEHVLLKNVHRIQVFKICNGLHFFYG